MSIVGMLNPTEILPDKSKFLARNRQIISSAGNTQASELNKNPPWKTGETRHQALAVEIHDP